MRSNWVIFLLATVVIIAVLIGGFLVANRPQRVHIDANLPTDFPAPGFSHASLEALLERHVDAHGHIDFGQWHMSHQDRAELDGYLAAVGAYSPDSTPERFEKRADKLAYWMYAYNGYVIRSVLDHWPIESVTDVKAPIEAVTGLGFFYRQKFLFGGTFMSLYSVENDIIRKSFQDARVHFVLYCASGSCPILRPELPSGDELEALLSEATKLFIGDPQNVSIDHEAAQIRLSAIFEMYRSDFERDLTRRGLPSEGGPLAYVASVAELPLRTELESAAGYEDVFMDYDWAIAGH
jgi:hypothetical protein